MKTTLLKVGHPTQKQMQAAAAKRFSDLCKTFNEIQTGPNPLSPEEVERLAALRPQYAFLSQKNTQRLRGKL